MRPILLAGLLLLAAGCAGGPAAPRSDVAENRAFPACVQTVGASLPGESQSEARAERLAACLERASAPQVAERPDRS
ncbi:MAG TPA: hypothetical protein VEB20_16345 [Azospirillaceae bacterium]|nr:hypothetical protein [Azospirillaceae bacterium]